MVQEMKEVIDKGSLADIVEKSYLIDRECSDYVVSSNPRRVFYYNPYDDVLEFKGDGESNTIHSSLTDYSLAQLCTMLGIPVPYMRKLKKHDMIETFADNINDWMMSFDKNLLVRQYKESTRGILSSRYSVFDTYEILKVVNGYFKAFEVKGYFLSPERFHLRLVSDRLPIEREDLYAGIQIDSSDVGRSSLHVQFFLYKLVCDNGLIMPASYGTLFKQRHVGLTAENFKAGFIEGFSRLPDTIYQCIKDIERARSKAIKYEFITPQGVERFLFDMKKSINLTEDQSQNVFELMRDKYGDTQWSLINALTELAHEFTLERRIEIESYAGKLLVA